MNCQSSLRCDTRPRARLLAVSGLSWSDHGEFGLAYAQYHEAGRFYRYMTTLWVQLKPCCSNVARMYLELRVEDVDS